MALVNGIEKYVLQNLGLIRVPPPEIIPKDRFRGCVYC